MGVFVIYVDRAGQYRWRLLANNNRITADYGEGYHALSDCEYGVRLVRQVAPLAQVQVQIAK